MSSDDSAVGFVRVLYVARRDVFVDGELAGRTGTPFAVPVGTHRFDLGEPRTYSPPEAVVNVSGATEDDPTRIEFVLLGTKGVDEAERAIAQRKEGGFSLRLTGLGLRRVPETLRNARGVEMLELGDNLLTELPAWLGELTSLAFLSVRANRLTTLPDSFAQLQNLTTLFASWNRLTRLPESLGELANLARLHLYHNRLSELPESMGQLASLQHLDLAVNQLETLPRSFGRLARLQFLDIHDNRLTALPAAIQRCTKLRVLFIHGNDQLELPRSLLGPPYADWPDPDDGPDAKAILDYYFRTRLAQDRRPLREAKLILVGRGEVGKTSLVRRLIENRFSRREDRTQGIRITQWPLAVTPDEQVRMHVWDFGGQEIMHTTHQFFLTDRSVYLLVLDGRGGLQESEADYWMRIIASFAPESPVVVVLNKILKDPFDLNRRALREKYPQIKEVVEVDSDNPGADGKPGANGLGIDELRKAIVRETDLLPDLRAPFPAAWFEIKENLANKRKNYLSFDEYRAICASNGETDEGAQESLATHLHRLGVALNFRDDRRLRETHVLNPHWVTEGIYALLNSPALAAAKGELRVGDLQEELDPKRYPREMHQFLLDLMEKFELCFSFGDRYLIPELLDPQQPREAEQFDPAVCLNFQYHYPVIPSGMMPRFIVRTHVLTQQWRWRSGVILQFEGNRALVKADLQERRVYIAIDGPVDGRRRMLAMIREDFDAIHRDIQRLRPAEMVPLPHHPQVVVPYRDLEVRAEKNPGAIWEQVVDDDVVSIPVRELLHGVDLTARPANEEPLLVFYSYAHADAKARLRLSKHLAPLRRIGLIADWYDHEILPGDQWADEIARKVKDADIVLLLISPDFVASPYCYAELEAAMQKDGAATSVIPIIVKQVNWTKLPFGELNALPANGKAIPKWKPNQDEGWVDVATGVERVAEMLAGRRGRRGLERR